MGICQDMGSMALYYQSDFNNLKASDSLKGFLKCNPFLILSVWCLIPLENKVFSDTPHKSSFLWSGSGCKVLPAQSSTSSISMYFRLIERLKAQQETESVFVGPSLNHQLFRLLKGGI